MLVDANIFLELFLDQEKADISENFLNEVSSGKKTAFVSSFTVDTVVITLVRKGVFPKKILSFLHGIVQSSGLKVFQLSIQDRIGSIRWMNKYGLDYEDSITLQSAISSGSDEILSFDRHFDKVKEVKRIEP